jgi:hypothetical protein
VHSGAALYIAAAQRELEGFDESFQTLTLALEVAPDNAPLLVALANECLYGEQLEMAIRLARRAVRLRPSLRPAWIVLARCYVRMGLYSLALITLNVTPPPPLPGPEQVSACAQASDCVPVNAHVVHGGCHSMLMFCMVGVKQQHVHGAAGDVADHPTHTTSKCDQAQPCRV